MRNMNAVIVFLVLAGFCSCQKELIEYRKGDLKVSVEQGDAWKHDFPLFLGIKVKNPPQVAIWLEDMQGNYLSTVYVSHKIATQGWQMAKGNRRKEALPVWCHARGVQYEDGLYLPTGEHPLTDGVSGATPRGSFDVKLNVADALQQFVVMMEVNHSTDFNDAYPKDAREGDANYSGGEEGSGQPALVYKTDVDLSTGQTVFEARLVGHSSPDGSTGEIYTDMSGLTTALQIVKGIIIHVQ